MRLREAARRKERAVSREMDQSGLPLKMRIPDEGESA
jgi:hypothetical protein